MAQVNIHTVSARNKLEQREAPYWHRMAAGQYIGFRKTSDSATGFWLAKYRDGDTGDRRQHSLGDFASVTPADQFDAAAEAAQAWFDHLRAGGRTGKATVADVCSLYIADLRTNGKDGAADDAERRFKQYVVDDPKFASTEVSKLTATQLSKWRTRLQDRPTPSGADRTASSLNRDITPFRAALNFAADHRIVTSDAAWAVTLRPITNADKRRTVYPNREEMRRIIDHAAPDLAEFLRALAMIPVRPGAMAALQVSDFNKSRNELTIPTDKAGENRTIKLPATTAAHFAQHCAGKTPAAHIFTRDDGKAWNKDSWKLPFKVAAIAAGVHVYDKAPTPIKAEQRLSKARESLKASTVDTLITIYSFRHAAITALIESGLPVQTIAQIAGTSPRMIHQNYGHLTDQASVAALERLAL